MQNQTEKLEYLHQLAEGGRSCGAMAERELEKFVDNEEKFLIEQYQSANHNVEILAKNIRELQTDKKLAENHAENCRQALIDYAEGNGILETDNFKITKTSSRSVDVTDVDSVPDKYIRIKKEVNKALIKAEGLTSEGNNWLQYSNNETYKITIRS